MLFSMQSIDYISLISGFSVSRNVLLVANRNAFFCSERKSTSGRRGSNPLGQDVGCAAGDNLDCFT